MAHERWTIAGFRGGRVYFFTNSDNLNLYMLIINSNLSICYLITNSQP
jgi:hypothetical protein